MSNGRVQLVATRDNIAELKIDGRTVFVPFIVSGTRVTLKFDGETYSVETASRPRARTREHSMGAPMPGVVLKILAEIGQPVTRGMPLLILEAMKMENEIQAPVDGTVDEIFVKPGDTVEGGAALVHIG